LLKYLSNQISVGLRLQIMSIINAIDIKSVAIRTIRIEAEAIDSLAEMIDGQFEAAIHAIASNKGRLVVSGIGKSAIIAQKLVATLNSTGTPAIFLHAADAIHGDLGIVQQEDVVMIISKSGESPEIKVLIPLLRNFGNTLIGMVGNVHSFLAKQVNIVLNTTVSQEACPNNLAPTSSTTAQLVMGDAIAIVLMEMKGFGSDDFARFHPGGTLGKKLYLRVADLYIQNEKPTVFRDTSLKGVISEISKKRLGAAVVTDENDMVIGVVTDGDLRRMLEKSISLEQATAKDIMTWNPKTIEAGKLAVEALDILRTYDITQLIVVESGRYLGILHLHDLVREGII
jgi:arabinose-5-phosphate isomerase